MKLTLLSQNEISTLSLPEKCTGRYWVRGRNENGKQMNIVSVEALRGAGENGEDMWAAKSNRRFVVVDKEDKVIPGVPIRQLALYRIRSADGTRRFTLFSEPMTPDRKQYSGYTVVGGNAEITIGRNPNNGICYVNGFTSDAHAAIVFSANGVFVKDLGSTNHTFVNGAAVSQKQLYVGDVVYIMGLQIVIAKNALFMNNPDGMVKVQTNALQPFHAPAFEAGANIDDEFEEVPTEHYYRAPRFKHDVGGYELKIDAPPNSQNNDEVPMIMLIGPSMTMGMASAASGLFTVTSAIERGNISSAIPSMVMCISMLLGTLMWPTVTKFYQKKLRVRKEAKRQQTYTAYLEKLEQLAAQETAREEQILRNNDANAATCAARILAPSPHKGRGILRLDKDTVVEFQTASITDANPPYPAIRKFCAKLAEVYAEFKAQKVPVLPEKVTEEFLAPFARQGDLSRVPVGVEKASLEVAYFDFSESVISPLLSAGGDWQELSDALAGLIAEKCKIRTLVLSPEGKCSAKSSERLRTYNDPQGCANAVSEIYAAVLRRNNDYKDKLAKGEPAPQYEPLFVVVQSVSALKSTLERFKVSDEAKEASDDTPFNCLQIAMWKCAREYNIHFLICEALSTLSPFTAENWYKQHISGNSGIWVGGGLNSQFRLTVKNKPQEFTSELEQGFGFVVKQAAAALVKFLQ